MKKTILIMKTRRLRKGFTLVEVIVVAVIVAILAAIGVPLYNSYVKSSAQNTAENTASSAASFLAAARSGSTNFAAPTPATLGPGAKWTYTTKQGNVTWICPQNASVSIADTTVKAKVAAGSDSMTSAAYPY